MATGSIYADGHVLPASELLLLAHEGDSSSLNDALLRNRTGLTRGLVDAGDLFSPGASLVMVIPASLVHIRCCCCCCSMQINCFSTGCVRLSVTAALPPKSSATLIVADDSSEVDENVPPHMTGLLAGLLTASARGSPGGNRNPEPPLGMFCGSLAAIWTSRCWLCAKCAPTFAAVLHCHPLFS